MEIGQVICFVGVDENKIRFSIRQGLEDVDSLAPVNNDFCPVPITGALRDLGPIELRQVRRTPEEKLFNSLIRQTPLPWL